MNFAEIVLTLAKENLFYAILLIILVFWWKYNWKILNDQFKTDSLNTRIKWIKENTYGNIYLSILGYVLDTLARWIGDKQSIENSKEKCQNKQNFICKTFGYNPWTTASFEFTFLIALVYSILSFIFFWTAGAESQVISFKYFQEKNNALFELNRLLLVIILGGVPLLYMYTYFTKRAIKKPTGTLLLLIISIVYFSRLYSKYFFPNN